jgi:hypothetical protein
MKPENLFLILSGDFGINKFFMLNLSESVISDSSHSSTNYPKKTIL